MGVRLRVAIVESVIPNSGKTVCVCGGGGTLVPVLYRVKCQPRKEGNVLFNDALNICYLRLYGVRKEGNNLFNDALNTFYLQLYGVRHMVKNNSDRKRGNPLPPHGLLFPISSKRVFFFICIIPQT